ncbi:hypothetical protein INP83_13385 [Mucilaginibacter sp. 21P]|uniref:hypothetical protein n=1 Tax=Mucilaginibacter TaxID=423349 RepID=UPI001645484B|nr:MULTISPECIES: hypothetical protein [Mucilaginibacter]QXV64087.1 hypothetical protein INP83_13385 [Mucilaginibacter sp. 21P]
MKKFTAVAIVVLVTSGLLASTTKHDDNKVQNTAKIEQPTSAFRKEVGTAD